MAWSPSGSGRGRVTSPPGSGRRCACSPNPGPAWRPGRSAPAWALIRRRSGCPGCPGSRWERARSRGSRRRPWPGRWTCYGAASRPPARLASLPAAQSNPEAFTGQIRRSLAAGGHHRLGQDPVVRRAAAAAAAWLEGGAIGAQTLPGRDAVFGHGDANLANFLWDGRRVRLVDFEDSGPSDPAFELAILVEHLSAWPDARLDGGAFVSSFGLTAAERARLLQFRRLAALFWLLHLRPGGQASRRNPPGTLRRQAERLLAPARLNRALTLRPRTRTSGTGSRSRSGPARPAARPGGCRAGPRRGTSAATPGGPCARASAAHSRPRPARS